MSWADDEGISGFWGDEPGFATPEIDFERNNWIDRTGKRYKISDMETRHIKNCIKVLERTTEKYDYEEEDEQAIKKKIKEFQKEINRRHNFKGKAF